MMHLEVLILLRKKIKKKIKRDRSTWGLQMLQNYRPASLGIQYLNLTAPWEGSSFYGYAHHSRTHR